VLYSGTSNLTSVSLNTSSSTAETVPFSSRNKWCDTMNGFYILHYGNMQDGEGKTMFS